jgi:hypothetical protein
VGNNEDLKLFVGYNGNKLPVHVNITSYKYLFVLIENPLSLFDQRRAGQMKSVSLPVLSLGREVS